MSFGARFGALVRERRRIEQLSQSDLAVRAFNDAGRRHDLSKLENGRIELPQEKTIDALCIALDIMPEEVSVCRGIVPVDLPSKLLRYLARQFGEQTPHRSESELAAFLVDCAERYRDQTKRLGELSATDAANARLLSEAAEAIGTADFSRADDLLAQAIELLDPKRTTETLRRESDLTIERGNVALFKGDPLEAAALFRSAAIRLLPVDESGAADLLVRASSGLVSYGARFQRAAIRAGHDLLNLAKTFAQGPTPIQVAINGIGAQIELAVRSDNAEAVALLEEGDAQVQATRKLLDSATTLSPSDRTQLALALEFSDARLSKERAVRASGLDKQRRLSEAADKYIRVLGTISKDDNAAMWSATSHNVGIALKRLAQVSPPVDARSVRVLASEHVQAALEIRTKERDEILWARTSATLADLYADLFHDLLRQDKGVPTRRVVLAANVAIDRYMECIEVARRRLPNDCANMLLALATIYANVRMFSAARNMIEDARPVLEAVGDEAGQSRCNYILEQLAAAEQQEAKS